MVMLCDDRLADALRGKRFGLVGFDHGEVAQIRVAATAVGAWVHILIQQSHPGLNSLAPFDVCVLNISQQGASPQKAPTEMVAMMHKPTILVGNRDEMARNALALASFKHEFIIRPWVEEDFLLRAFRVLRNAEEPNERAGHARENDEPVIVLADDDRVTVMLVSSMLRGSNLQCIVASNGSEALALARKVKPDVLLLDVSMPEMDGFEVLAALKNDPATNRIRVMMLTATQTESEVVRGFSLGADDYVTKPFQPNEMMARLRRLIRYRQAA